MQLRLYRGQQIAHAVLEQLQDTERILHELALKPIPDMKKYSSAVLGSFTKTVNQFKKEHPMLDADQQVIADHIIWFTFSRF